MEGILLLTMLRPFFASLVLIGLVAGCQVGYQCANDLVNIGTCDPDYCVICEAGTAGGGGYNISKCSVLVLSDRPDKYSAGNKPCAVCPAGRWSPEGNCAHLDGRLGSIDRQFEYESLTKSAGVCRIFLL